MVHGLPSLGGWLRMATKSPFFAAKLLALRMGFFVTRRLLFNLRDARGFAINSHYALISYWDFFIERALQDDSWTSGFRSEPHPVAIDVGANAGMFSYLLATLNPRAEIYAFEPLPDLERSIRNVQVISGNTFHVFSAACGREQGKSVLCAEDCGDTDARLAEVGEGTKKKRFEVQVLAVDDVVETQEVFLMKIDTQGYEIPVLEGARRTLACTRHLIVEANCGAELSRIQKTLGPAWQGRPLSPCDFLFSRA